MQTVWSPNNGPALINPIWLVVHTAQGATTDESLASYIANSANQVSYHYLLDDDSETQTVGEDRQSWSALGANAFGIHFCTTGFAAWSRDQWLQHSRMLDLLAARMKEVGGRYGIDGEHLNDDQIRQHVRGSIGHGDYARATGDGDHTDPGPNFPWDYVQARMGTGTPPTPPPAPPAVITQEVDMTPDQDARLARIEAFLAVGIGRNPNANPPTFDGGAWAGTPRQIATAALMAAETAAARAADCSRKLDAILAAPAGTPGAPADVTTALKAALAALTLKASI